MLKAQVQQRKKCDHLATQIAMRLKNVKRVRHNNYDETIKHPKWIRPWHSFRVGYQYDANDH